MPEDGYSVDGDSFIVLVNAEDQHSLWPSAKAIPDGWTQAFGPGDRVDCLAYVNRAWTDMRPLSLRRAMEAGG